MVVEQSESKEWVVNTKRKMTNNNKKYEMGGAVQSFSSPMLAQGMQGGLSGFGTSGLGMFADGGQISDIERILAKYRAITSNNPKQDKTSEFLNKSWEGKNLDDYIMYSDRYKRGGEVPSIGDSGTITDKNSMFLGKMATITADLGNMYEVRVGERTTIVKKNGINIVSDQYADGGEVNKYEATFDQLKKGDVISISYGDAVSKNNETRLQVKSKNLVGKGKSWESEKITFSNLENPNGVKYFAYKRKNGYISFASGDMAISVRDISIENKFEHGGSTSHSNNGKINGKYLDSLSEIKQRRILMNVANHYNISLEEANDELRDEEAELLYEYIADDNTLKMSIYYQFQDNMNKYAKGGEFEEEESMDVQFIEYNGEEIMYEPIMKKYYANDVEFDTLKEAQKFLDSGEMSDSIRGAYARGLYEKGGELKKPTWIAIYEKGSQRKVFELNANSREEAKIEAEKGKKQYKIPEEMFLYDVFRKFANGGDVADPISYAKTLGRDSQDWEAQLKEYAGDQYNTLTQEEKREIIANIQAGYDRNTHFAKGGEVDRISIGDNVYAYFAHNYVGYQLVESPSMGEPYDGKVIDIINENNQKKYVVKFENGETKKLSQGIFDDYVIKEKFAKGGKIGFEGLAKKVAKRYKGKAVSKEYQAEYGKTYDQKEAKEVGNKVAAKVYRQQVAKKKIVRKLQRKTN